MKQKNKLTGFTLLEILIVVVIVGILASLAIPNYQKALERAKGAEAVANLQILRGAEVRYFGEYDVLDPSLTHIDVENPNATGGHYFFYNMYYTDPNVPGHFYISATRSEYSAYPFRALAVDNAGTIYGQWPPGLSSSELPMGFICAVCHP